MNKLDDLKEIVDFHTFFAYFEFEHYPISELGDYVKMSKRQMNALGARLIEFTIFSILDCVHIFVEFQLAWASVRRWRFDSGFLCDLSFLRKK